MEIYDFDIVAGNNNGTPPNGFPEFMEYDEVNDASRELMAALARFLLSGLSGKTSTAGTQPDYELTSQLSLSSYAEGQLFAFTAHATSTGAVTLAVDGLASAAIVDSRGQALGSGDITEDGIYIVLRTATNFQLVGGLSSLSVQALALNTLGSAYQAGGTADALTLTTGLFTAYANGQLVAFRGGTSNTGAATINIDGLGAEALEDYRSAALSAADIQSGRVYLAGRTGGEWRIIAGLPTDLANEVVGVLPVTSGGTGGTTPATARAGLELDTDDAVEFGSILANGAIESTGEVIAGGDTGALVSEYQGSGQGGRVRLLQGADSTLAGTHVRIDTDDQRIRILEDGGAFRGAYFNISDCRDGVATSLLNREELIADVFAENVASVVVDIRGLVHLRLSFYLYARTDSVTAIMRVSVDNGSSFPSTSYAYNTFDDANGGSASETQINLNRNNLGNQTSEAMYGELTMRRPDETFGPKGILVQSGHRRADGAPVSTKTYGQYHGSSAAVTHLLFATSSGNLDMAYQLYGVRTPVLSSV